MNIRPRCNTATEAYHARNPALVSTTTCSLRLFYSYCIDTYRGIDSCGSYAILPPLPHLLVSTIFGILFFFCFVFWLISIVQIKNNISPVCAHHPHLRTALSSEIEGAMMLSEIESEICRINNTCLFLVFPRHAHVLRLTDTHWPPLSLSQLQSTIIM